jgi:hypothetical protein
MWSSVRSRMTGSARFGLWLVLVLTLAASASRVQAQTEPPANEATVDAAPPVPATPEEMPPTAPEISFHDGKLSIVAENSRLADVLKGIQEKTGADIDTPEGLGDERVVVHLGPGPARDVLGDLFYGMPVNYVIAGSDTDPLEVRSIVLVKRAVSNTAVTASRAPSSYSPAATRAAEAQQAVMERMRVEAEQAAATQNTADAAIPAENAVAPPMPAQPGPALAPVQANAAAAVPDASAAPDTSTASASGGSSGADGKPQRPIDQMSNMMFRMYQERQQMIQQQKNPPKPAPEP